MKKLQPRNFLIYFHGLFIIEFLLLFPNKIFAKDVNKNKLIEVNIKSNHLQSKNIDYGIENLNKIDLSKSEVIKDLKAEGKNLFNLLAFEQKDLEKKYFVEIDSDIQYREEEVFFAKGNAIIYLSDATLRGDLIKYDLKNKLLTVIGNVIFQKGKQYFEASKLSYDLRNDTGYIDNVYGILNSDSFAKDFKLELDNNDRKLVDQEIIYDVEQPKYVNTATLGLVNQFEEDKSFNITNANLNIPSISKWRYKTEKLIYNSKTLESKEIYFTNDLYNKPQFVFLSKNFSSEIIDNKLRLISRNSWLVLDDKLSIPIGRRSFFDRDPLTKWGFGADFRDKDGYYLFRGTYPREIFKDYSIQIQPYFLIQRVLKGKTNAFTRKNSSILSKKVESDIDFYDYFGVDVNLKGKEGNWDIESKSQLNSLNSERLDQALRSKFSLTKRINLNSENDTNFKITKNSDSKALIGFEEENYSSPLSSGKIELDSTDIYSKENKSLFTNFLDFQFYGTYREKVIKDFATEELHFASGFNLSNKKDWLINDKKSSLALIYDVGYFKSERTGAREFTEAFRNSFVTQYNYEFPLWKKSSLDQVIDKSYKFTPKVIDQSLKWSAGFDSGLFLYSEGSTQSVLKFNTGPVYTLGSFKKKFFDYTKISVKYSYLLKGGESPFKFDNLNKDPRINIDLKQQVYGPLVFSYENTFNLNDGTYHNEIYSLDFNRRAYSLGAFYNATDESVGIRFNIYNFDYSGLSPEF